MGEAGLMQLLETNGDVMKSAKDPPKVKLHSEFVGRANIPLGKIKNQIEDDRGRVIATQLVLAAVERAHDPVHPSRSAGFEQVALPVVFGGNLLEDAHDFPATAA